ncbi:hypothetical protein TrST_g8324 [Triparma strigata]|nr:hypothetical protein TrST_g8324 [Triparma strigata]
MAVSVRSLLPLKFLKFLFFSLFTVASLGVTQNSHTIRVIEYPVSSSPPTPVPLTLLRSSGNYLQYYTDSSGTISLTSFDLLSQTVDFNVYADGYSLSNVQPPGTSVETYPSPYDNLVQITTTLNSETTIYMTRDQPAKREYRLTGSGLYVEAYAAQKSEVIPSSIKRSGREVIDDVKVLGQDTLMLGSYKNETYFFFGDTTCLQSARQNNCEGYGMYTVGAKFPGAVDPDEPPALKYFKEKDGGFEHVKPMAVVEPLEQNSWVAGVIVLGDRMYANYVKNPGDGESAGAIATGMMVWDDEEEEFHVVSVWPDDHGFLNGAHTIQRLGPDEVNDGYIYFDNNLRVKRLEESILDHLAYEIYDYTVGSWVQYDHDAAKFRRRFNGRRPKLTRDSGEPQSLGVTSVEWNEHLKSYLCLLDAGRGELWLGVANTLTPFPKFTTESDGVFKVADHSTSGSSCYNQILIPQLYSSSDSVVRFACTFTSMWSENTSDEPTWTTCLFGMKFGDGCSENVGRYEYNNLVYSVDLRELYK